MTRSIPMLLAALMALAPAAARADLDCPGTPPALFATPGMGLNGLAFTAHHAWGDYDGDGDLDALIGTGGGVSALLATNDLTQLTASGFGSAVEHGAVAWIDVDGDGDLDASLTEAQGSTRVYENQGGLFGAGFPIGNNSSDLYDAAAWGDIDNDGLPELVVATGLGVEMFDDVNTGYAPAVSTITAAAAVAVAIGDINGDGLLDIVVGQSGAPVQLWLQITAGNFTLSGSSTATPQVTALALGDVNGDLQLDVLVGDTNGFSLLSGGDGLATEIRAGTSVTTTDLALFDTDGDTVLEVAIGTGTSYELWSWDGASFVYEDAAAAVGPVSVQFADVDADGNVEMTMVDDMELSAVHEFPVGYATESVTTLGLPSSAQDVAWADFDGNGTMDLAVAWQTDLRVYMNGGGYLTECWSSAAQTSPPVAAPNRPAAATTISNITDLAWGDANVAADPLGALELAVAQNNDSDLVLEFDPTRTCGDVDLFSISWERGDTERSTSVVWSDLTSDGQPELVIGGKGSSGNGTNYYWAAPITTWEAAGAGQFVLASSFLPPELPLAVHGLNAADFDSDGRMDVLRQGVALGGGSVQCPFNSNGSGYTTGDCIGPGHAMGSAIADFDADGTPDTALTTVNVGPPLRVLGLNQGDAKHGISGLDLDVADDDGDGDPDLVFTTTTGLWIAQFEASAGVLAEGWCDGNDTGGNQVVAWADVDGDGDLDLARLDGEGLDLLRSQRIGAAAWAALDRGISSPPEMSVRILDPARGGPLPLPARDGGSGTVLTDPLLEVELLIRDLDGDAASGLTLSWGSDGGGWSPMLLGGAGLPSVLETDVSACATVVGGYCSYIVQWDAATDVVRGDGISVRAVLPSHTPGRIGGSVTRAVLSATSEQARVWAGPPPGGFAACYGSDVDADGWPCHVDCDDGLATVNPGAAEVCDGIDNNCEGAIDEAFDADGDGALDSVACFGVATYPPGSLDCDDSEPLAFPGNLELCSDGIDNDCDGVIDNATDADADGQTDCDGDCDDSDPTVGAGFPELCDGLDNDCDLGVDEGIPDTDGDGFLCPDDCDEGDATIYAGATEIPGDGIDQDCNGNDAAACFEDVDGDGYGFLPGAMGLDGGCWLPGLSPFSNDCDDANAAISPNELELCNGWDDNCDGVVDEAPDLDGDGVACSADCDEYDATSFPGAPELCDGLDNDCDGLAQDTLDADNDGYSGVCDGDCDDSDASINPGAAEQCDWIDSNCNGSIVDWFTDANFDGIPDCLSWVSDADQDGFTTAAGDCNDLDPTVYPGALEVCDTVDSDCNGSIVDGFTNVLPPLDVPECGDSDGDGVDDGADCVPDDPNISPVSQEIVGDGVDQDCNGFDSVYCYQDLDQDGWGATTQLISTIGTCDQVGIAASTGDCDDTDPFSNPGAPEICDGRDNNCDGLPVDESGPELSYFLDSDEDGFGSEPHPWNDLCGPVDGYVTTDGDCDDEDDAIHPDALEVCDDVDDNCNGSVADGWEDLDGDDLPDCEDDDADGDGFVDVDAGGDDCNDMAAMVHPEAEEVCDGEDTDCDPITTLDETDDDDDGAWDCEDCDDTDGAVSPYLEEICDGLDNDCVDGVPQEEIDDDGDSYAPCAGDCDDASGTRFPGAVEICDDPADDDCDGAEGELGSDPECWAPACATSERGATPLAFLLLLLVPLRRRRLSAALVLLLLPAVALAQDRVDPVEAARTALVAGDCAAALEFLTDPTEALVTDPEHHRLRGDALLCTGDAPNALRAWARYEALGGSPIRVQAQTSALRARFGALAILGPDVPVVWLEVDGRRLRPIGPQRRFVGLEPGARLVLVAGGEGLAPRIDELRPVTAGEQREITVLAEPGALAQVQIPAHDHPEIRVEIEQPQDRIEAPPGVPVDVLAGPARIHLTTSAGTVVSTIELSAGETRVFDPTPWLPVALLLPALPAGSALSVFVEGRPGVSAERVLEVGPAVAVDAETGVPLTAPITLDGLVAGSGGLYLDHPRLGTTVVELRPGAETASLEIDWRRMAGVAETQAGLERWRQQRARVLRQGRSGQVAGLMLVGAGLIAGGVMSGVADQAQQEARAWRTAANDAVAGADFASAKIAQGLHTAALARRDRLVVGAGLAFGAAGVGGGLMIVVPLRTRGQLDRIGPWAAWSGAPEISE